MHEYAIVESLVQQVISQVATTGKKVDSIRFRRGSAFSEPSLMQAFQLLSAGTPLEGASVQIETVNRDFTCPQCHHSQVIQSDDLIGHMFVCPGCGKVEDIEEAHDLEILEIRVGDQTTTFPSGQSSSAPA